MEFIHIGYGQTEIENALDNDFSETVEMIIELMEAFNHEEHISNFSTITEEYIGGNEDATAIL
jgi:hypothetical protein